MRRLGSGRRPSDPPSAARRLFVERPARAAVPPLSAPFDDPACPASSDSVSAASVGSVRPPSAAASAPAPARVRRAGARSACATCPSSRAWSPSVRAEVSAGPRRAPRSSPAGLAGGRRPAAGGLTQGRACASSPNSCSTGKTPQLRDDTRHITAPPGAPSRGSGCPARRRAPTAEREPCEVVKVRGGATSAEVLVRPRGVPSSDTDHGRWPGTGSGIEAIGSKRVEVRPRPRGAPAAGQPVEHDEEAREAPAGLPALQATLDPRQAALIDPCQPGHGPLADPRPEPPFAQPAGDRHRGVPVDGVVVPHRASTALPPYPALTPERPNDRGDVASVITPTTYPPRRARTSRLAMVGARRRPDGGGAAAGSSVDRGP